MELQKHDYNIALAKRALWLAHTPDPFARGLHADVGIFSFYRQFCSSMLTLSLTERGMLWKHLSSCRQVLPQLLSIDLSACRTCYKQMNVNSLKKNKILRSYYGTYISTYRHTPTLYWASPKRTSQVSQVLSIQKLYKLFTIPSWELIWHHITDNAFLKKNNLGVCLL